MTVAPKGGWSFDRIVTLSTLCVLVGWVFWSGYWVSNIETRLLQVEIDIGAGEQSSVGNANEIARVERETNRDIDQLTNNLARFEERLAHNGETLGELRDELRAGFRDIEQYMRSLALSADRRAAIREEGSQ